MAETLPLHNGYGSSGCLYSDLDEIVATAVDKLAGLDFDTIAGTGMSGSIVIPLLVKALNDAHGTEINFLLIRKDGAGAHTDNHVGRLGGRWIFVDDFVSSGSTRDRVRKAVGEIVRTANRYRNAEWPQFATTFVGSYLYASYPEPGFIPEDETKSGCSCPSCQGAEPF